MLAISNEVETLGVDLAKAQFKDSAENYEVNEVPYLIVFEDGIATIKESPTESTVQKIQAFKRIQAVNDLADGGAPAAQPEAANQPPDAGSPSPAAHLDHATEEESTVEPVKIDIDNNQPRPQPQTPKPDATEAAIEETTENDHELERPDNDATAEPTQLPPRPTPQPPQGSPVEQPESPPQGVPATPPQGQPE